VAAAWRRPGEGLQIWQIKPPAGSAETQQTPNAASGRCSGIAALPACTKHHLVVEADGGQHADNEDDERRTAFRRREGWRVIRFWNNDIFANTEGVIETILRALSER
jgi:Protein of unknown function (DUF559)